MKTAGKEGSRRVSLAGSGQKTWCVKKKHMAVSKIKSGCNPENSKRAERLAEAKTAASADLQRERSRRQPVSRPVESFIRRKVNGFFRKGRPSASLKANASYTVEAAFVLPMFLLAGIAVIFFFRVIQVEWGVQTAISDVARSAAISGDIFSEMKTGAIQALCAAEIAGKGVPYKFVLGGPVGINLSGTTVDDKEVSIKASYVMKVPTTLFGWKHWHISQRALARRWVGDDPGDVDEADKYVYVTESGSVYHTNLSCAYLNPSIRGVFDEQLSDERNVNGAIYYPCPSCRKKGFSGIWYVTDYGTNYHTTLRCPGLKRTINRMKLQDAIDKGYPLCSKCEKNGGKDGDH